jgi:hypothetical protein
VHCFFGDYVQQIDFVVSSPVDAKHHISITMNPQTGKFEVGSYSFVI